MIFRRRTLAHSSAPVAVILYTKPDCTLCERARTHLTRLQGRFPHTLTLVDITNDPSLFERYKYVIPVLVIDGSEYPAPLTPPVLERALANAIRGGGGV